MKPINPELPGQKSNSLLLIVLIVIFSIITLYLYISSKALKTELANKSRSINISLQARLNEGRRILTQDLEEKYKADVVSYQAMAKRLKVEEQKAK